MTFLTGIIAGFWLTVAVAGFGACILARIIVRGMR